MWGILFIIILLISCTRKEEAVPEYVIPKDKMIQVLTDLHIAQAAVITYQYSDTLRFSMNDYSTKVLELHQLRRGQFDSSIAYYTTRPVALDEMYEQVINELSKQQGGVQ